MLLIGPWGTNFIENFIKIQKFSFNKNAFKNVVWKMAAILSRLQYVNYSCLFQVVYFVNHFSIYMRVKTQQSLPSLFTKWRSRTWSHHVSWYLVRLIFPHKCSLYCHRPPVCVNNPCGTQLVADYVSIIQQLSLSLAGVWRHERDKFI